MEVDLTPIEEAATLIANMSADLVAASRTESGLRQKIQSYEATIDRLKELLDTCEPECPECSEVMVSDEYEQGVCHECNFRMHKL